MSTKSQIHWISPNPLRLADLESLIQHQKFIQLSPQSRQATEHGFQFLKNYLQQNPRAIYGINTGFGSLCDVRISDHQIQDLQHNLVRSHACGMGEEVPDEIVKILLFLKIQSLSYGFSGVRVEVLERLLHFYNHNALPIVYQLGSLGASGDLAPLAHLSLPLFGEGKMKQNGNPLPPPQYLATHGLEPLQLAAKEGLALLNGTQFSTGYGVWCVLKAKRLLRWANTIAALSLDGFDCRLEPFDAKLHAIRPHRGQQQTAKAIRHLLKYSQIAEQEKTAVQDPYAFRCVPQVHGASADAIQYIEKTIETEINSVTDNPTIFPDENEILSGGNFHAQPLALALDFLAIALAELGSISERRIFQLMLGKRGLPVFLTEQAGLNSGLMIAQYTAASIASQNKQLCTPASVDNVVSSNGQEDHVSMAANAATKCYRVVENVERLLAIELLCAAQAVELRRPLRTSPILEKILTAYREKVPLLRGDRILHFDLEASVQFIKTFV